MVYSRSERPHSPIIFTRTLFFLRPVELPIKDLFPGAEVEPALGYGHYDLPSHDLPFQMGIGVVFPHVMAVLRGRFMGGQSFQPAFKILVSPGSSSLINTEAVMCMALIKASPSWIRLSRRHSSTWGVMLTKALRVGI